MDAQSLVCLVVPDRSYLSLRAFLCARRLVGGDLQKIFFGVESHAVGRPEFKMLPLSNFEKSMLAAHGHGKCSLLYYERLPIRKLPLCGQLFLVSFDPMQLHAGWRQRKKQKATHKSP